jgi:hypothetical protein
VDHVEEEFLSHQLDFHLFVVEMSRYLRWRLVDPSNRLSHSTYFPDLSHGVVDKPAPLASVMQRQTLFGLVLANETRGSHPGIRELKIFMQII